MLNGEVRITREGAEPETAGSRCDRLYQTLAGVPFPVRAEVVTAGQCIRFLRSDVLDLLADDIGLLRGIFSGLLRASETLVRRAALRAANQGTRMLAGLKPRSTYDDCELIYEI